ncbi:MAG: hypothetical protein R6X02_21300 [Enhygromyxa sp.]
MLPACEIEDDPQRKSIGPPDMEAVRVYESNRIEIYTQPNTAFCRGDGARMDAHVDRLVAKFGAEPPRVPVYVVPDDWGESIADWCFGSFNTLAGCFQPWVIMSKFWAVPHELNHVVLEALNNNRNVRGASLFWFEAYASTWETDASARRIKGLPEQSTWAAYRTADHLIRWLEDIRGPAAVRDFYAALGRDWEPEEVEAAFVEIFGMSYAQALERYQTQAPLLYPGFGWCEDVELIELGLGTTRFELRFDCEAADTYALADFPAGGMYLRRVLRLERPSELRIESSRELGVLKRHPCLERPIEAEDDLRLADSAWFEARRGASMESVSIIEAVPAGDNLIEFVVPLGEPVEVEVRVRAKPLESAGSGHQ